MIKMLWRPRLYAFSGLLLFGAGAGVAWGTWKNICSDCPSIAQIRTFEPEQTSKLYSHDGRLLAEIGIERRTPVSINALPDYVRQAFVAVEDKRFYEHPGIDVRGIARAVVGVLTGQNRGGGSTITQQLARNMFDQIGFERRVFWKLIARKLKELQVALALERAYTKEQILEAYINEINYGHGWWGIQTAARNYFAKNASELNPAEVALLAAIPNLPAFYSPLLRPDNAKRRRDLVLRRMVEQGYLPAEDLKRYTLTPIPTERAVADGSIAPYFEEWVRQILDDRFGSKLYTSGLKVYTTLDVRMQRAAEISMQEGWERIEARPGFEHLTFQEHQDSLAAGVDMSELNYVQGLFVSLDPWTGSVRAMIGGRDFQVSKFNRATQALRQAGSGFKPFVYTAAIASRIPPTFVVVDAPVVTMQVDGTEWRPSNFSERFEGPMTIRTGLMKSQNIIAIKLATEEVGLESVAQTARRMGIRSEIERYPSTAIGAAEVIPIQMAEAYSTFANQGTKVRPFPILRVEDAQGRIIWDPQPERTQVLDPLVTRIMTSMLQGVVDGGTGNIAIRIVAGLNREVVAAGKTGTTNDGTDVWFNGFTPNLLATVWFGLDLPQSIRRGGATGGGDAAPVWGNFMRRVYYGDPEALDEEMREPVLPVPEPWPVPDGIVTRLIDKTTGKLASQWCPQEDQMMELFLPGTEPTNYCDRDDSRIFRALEDIGGN